jgi:hypothetical protein
MSEPTAAVKLQLVKNRIQIAENTIYDLTLEKRIRNRCGDKEGEKRAIDETVKMELMLDELRKVETELKDA